MAGTCRGCSWEGRRTATPCPRTLANTKQRVADDLRLMSRLLRVTCLLVALAWDGCSPFASRKPNWGNLLGEYVLTDESLRRLRSDGYPAADTSITLGGAWAMSFHHMPDCWLTDVGEPHGKFDSGYGTWDLAPAGSYWVVTFLIAGFTPDSAVQTEKGIVPEGIRSNGGSWTFVAMVTDDRPARLAIAIASSDRGYLEFRRK